MNLLWILVLKNWKEVALFKKANVIFLKGYCRIFPYTLEKKDIYEMKYLSVSQYWIFHCWCSVSPGRYLIESVLKGFHCVFPSDPLTGDGCIQSERSSNGRCCQPTPQSGLRLNCSCLLRGWRASRSTRGQGRPTREAMALHRGQKKSGGEKEMVLPPTHPLNTNLSRYRVRSRRLPDRDQRRGSIIEVLSWFWGQDSVRGKGKVGTSNVLPAPCHTAATMPGSPASENLEGKC